MGFAFLCPTCTIYWSYQEIAWQRHFVLLQVEWFKQMLWLTVGLTVDGWPLNIAISLYLFEIPCKSWKKILKKEMLNMTWHVSWVFWYVFPTNLGDYLVVLLTFCLEKVFWGKGKLFQWIIWLFLFMHTISVTWIFLILMSNACRKNFWCHTDIWVTGLTASAWRVL